MLLRIWQAARNVNEVELRFFLQKVEARGEMPIASEMLACLRVLIGTTVARSIATTALLVAVLTVCLYAAESPRLPTLLLGVGATWFLVQMTLVLWNTRTYRRLVAIRNQSPRVYAAVCEYVFWRLED